MTHLTQSFEDDKFYQEYLDRNGEIGVAQLEIAIKEAEEKQQYELCGYLATQIEIYHKNKTD